MRQAVATPASIAAVDERDRLVLDAIQNGLPLTPKPYAAVGQTVGMSEREILERLERLAGSGVIKRFGLVVRHHELGYNANAMVVWDLPDWKVTAVGRHLATFDFVTLCYRRQRSLPEWRYNLYCMIHGQDRSAVETHIAKLVGTCALTYFPHAVLFSRRRFKQCGADYRDGRRATAAAK